MDQKTLKNMITNIAAVLVLVGATVQQSLNAMQGDAIDWFAVGGALVIAVIGYFTGKK